MFGNTCFNGEKPGSHYLLYKLISSVDCNLWIWPVGTVLSAHHPDTFQDLQFWGAVRYATDMSTRYPSLSLGNCVLGLQQACANTFMTFPFSPSAPLVLRYQGVTQFSTKYMAAWSRDRVSQSLAELAVGLWFGYSQWQPIWPWSQNHMLRDCDGCGIMMPVLNNSPLDFTWEKNKLLSYLKTSLLLKISKL